MKRYYWLVVTLFTVLLTAFILTHAGRLGLIRSARATPRCVELRSQVRSDDPFLSEAAFRWRQGMPNHWHACLLQQ